jgi:hypothetical protein
MLFNKKILNCNEGLDRKGPCRIEKLLRLSDDDTPKLDWRELVNLIHTPEYVESIRKGCRDKAMMVDVKTSPGTFEAACVSIALCFYTIGHRHI